MKAKKVYCTIIRRTIQLFCKDGPKGENESYTLQLGLILADLNGSGTFEPILKKIEKIASEKYPIFVWCKMTFFPLVLHHSLEKIALKKAGLLKFCGLLNQLKNDSIMHL